MLPRHRRLRRGFYALLARAVLSTATRLPTRLGRFVGRATARSGLWMMRRERRRASRNLRRAFGEGTSGNSEAFLRRAADRLGENFFDALTVERWRDEGFARVAEDGALALLQDLRREGRGVLILTGHLGCWELLGAWLAQEMGGLVVVTGVIHNEPVDRLVNDRRRRLGMTPVPRDGDLRPLLKQLREGGVAAVLMDQNTRVENLDVPFFGTPAPTARGFARMAFRTGAPVLPLAIARDSDGHQVIHGPPLRPERYASGNCEWDLLVDCNRALEALILRNPEEWVWFHRRWPDDDESAGDGLEDDEPKSSENAKELPA
jgi:KDO2-lipid IV(A) lauroyltransferase